MGSRSAHRRVSLRTNPDVQQWQDRLDQRPLQPLDGKLVDEHSDLQADIGTRLSWLAAKAPAWPTGALAEDAGEKVETPGAQGRWGRAVLAAAIALDPGVGTLRAPTLASDHRDRRRS
jgi:hypothetical protein